VVNQTVISTLDHHSQTLTSGHLWSNWSVSVLLITGSDVNNDLAPKAEAKDPHQA